MPRVCWGEGGGGGGYALLVDKSTLRKDVLFTSSGSVGSTRRWLFKTLHGVISHEKFYRSCFQFTLSIQKVITLSSWLRVVFEQ